MAIAADAAVIAQLQANPYTTSWTAEDFKKWLLLPGILALKAIMDDQLVGYLLVTTAPQQADILDFAVAHQYRRQGAGAALLKTALNQLQIAEISELWGEVAVGNTAAWELYQTFGAQAQGLRRNYYQLAGQKQNAQRFCIPVATPNNVK